MRNKETAKEIFIEAQQNYEKYDTLNPGAIKINDYKILKDLQRNRNGSYKYQFIVYGLLLPVELQTRHIFCL